MGRVDNLLYFLDEICETGIAILSLDEIREAATHRYSLVRSSVCKALQAYPKEFSKELLLILIKDKNKDVRSDAVIQLYDSIGDAEIIVALWNVFLNDTDSISRGYAGAALIKFCYHDKDSVDKITETLLQERNMFVRATCYGEIYGCSGDEFVLKKLLRCFNSKVYQTRCAVCNILIEFLKKEDVSIVVNLIPQWRKKESTIAVLSSIEDLKKRLDELME